MPRTERDDLPVFYGPMMVAQWCGVSRAAVGNWLRRYDDFPEPAGQVCGPVVTSYFWRGDQREDWLRWVASKDVCAFTGSANG